MKKRLLPLLVVVLLLTTASAAMASHCPRCRFGQPSTQCVTSVVPPGFTECFINSEGLCETSGVQCSSHGFAPDMATEWVVASVERLDEPSQPEPRQPLVAQAELPATR